LSAAQYFVWQFWQFPSTSITPTLQHSSTCKSFEVIIVIDNSGTMAVPTSQIAPLLTKPGCYVHVKATAVIIESICLRCRRTIAFAPNERTVLIAEAAHTPLCSARFQSQIGY